MVIDATHAHHVGTVTETEDGGTRSPTVDDRRDAQAQLDLRDLGHAVAALWHHFISRDTVLLRMLPARFSSSPDSSSVASDLVPAKSS